jgi:glycerophosphoryl diester phosphodiesterase
MHKKLIRYILGLIVIFVLTYEVLCLVAKPISDHSYFNPGGFLVIAHRGGRDLGPETTLYTFQRAVDLGVDVLEMDLRSTKDGELIVIHDSTVDRTTNGTGFVQDFSLAELKTLDAGHRWSPDNGRSFPMRGKGLTVPTLAEVFKAFPDTRMNIEIKESQTAVIAALCRLIRDYQKTKHVMIASFDVSQLKKFRAQCPQVATSVGARETFLFYGLQWAYLEKIYSPPAQALQVPEYYGNTQVITQRFLEAAHARNMRVHVWTVNDKKRMQELINLGVDGIITDYPGRLLRLLERKIPSKKRKPDGSNHTEQKGHHKVRRRADLP